MPLKFNYNNASTVNYFKYLSVILSDPLQHDFFTCSFNSVTCSLGLEWEPFGARKQYAMTISN